MNDHVACYKAPQGSSTKGGGALKRQHLRSHLRNESWDSKAETGARHVERDERACVGSTGTEGAWRQTHLINAGRFLRTATLTLKAESDKLPAASASVL